MRYALLVFGIALSGCIQTELLKQRRREAYEAMVREHTRRGELRLSLLPNEPIVHPKELAIAEQRDDIVRAVEACFRASGFRVKRHSVGGEVTRRDGDALVSFKEATTRFVLELDYSGTRDSSSEVLLERFSFELLDRRSNEVILAGRASGLAGSCDGSLMGTVVPSMVAQIGQRWVDSTPTEATEPTTRSPKPVKQLDL